MYMGKKVPSPVQFVDEGAAGSLPLLAHKNGSKSIWAGVSRMAHTGFLFLCSAAR
jgi:hypothetical protein